jgi:2-oxoglutarate ferredoxin oxidoreductase subunit beta
MESIHGMPIRISEIFSQIVKAAYVARVSVHNPKEVKNAKKALLKAFTYQQKKLGFSIVEFVSTCPVNWGMTPMEALDWAKKDMIDYFPLGVFKDVGDENV